MFKLIIISPPEVNASHLSTIGQLLHYNISFHLRLKSPQIITTGEILDSINPGLRGKIVIHQDHHLAPAYQIKGIHLTEQERINYKSFTGDQTFVSTSIHSLNDFKRLKDKFEYIFFSPVFQSVSKSDYFPLENFNSLKEKLHRTVDKKKLIALGGITPDNIREVREAGFGGAAVLGAIWSAADPIKAYSDLERAARGVER